jgi:hypothetical protein
MFRERWISLRRPVSSYSFQSILLTAPKMSPDDAGDGTALVIAAWMGEFHRTAGQEHRVDIAGASPA